MPKLRKLYRICHSCSVCAIAAHVSNSRRSASRTGCYGSDLHLIAQGRKQGSRNCPSHLRPASGSITDFTMCLSGALGPPCSASR